MNAFLGCSPVYSYLSCKWVCLVLQTMRGVCLGVLCIPRGHGWFCPTELLSVLLFPFFRSHENFLCSKTVPCLCFLLFVSIPCVSVASAG